jgi:hypothetical protein
MFRITNIWNNISIRASDRLSNLQSPVNTAENSLKLDKTADLYFDKVYTVIPKDMELNQGIFPEDQKFSPKYVFLWDNWRDLVMFPGNKWKKVTVYLPHEVKFSELTRIPGNGYGIKYIPNTWKIEEQEFTPQYNA